MKAKVWKTASAWFLCQMTEMLSGLPTRSSDRGLGMLKAELQVLVPL